MPASRSPILAAPTPARADEPIRVRVFTFVEE
jgi:hypothetical protein